MGRQSGVYQDAKGRWRVDRVHRGERFQGRFGSYEEAERWLIARCAELDAVGPIKNRGMTFAEAATRYLLEQKALGEKVSLESEAYMLQPVVEFCGDLPLGHIHDGTLQKFKEQRLASGRTHKTVNLSINIVKNVLRAAKSTWRVNLPDGRSVPVLESVPELTTFKLAGRQRAPRPISWEEQERLLSKLPMHLARMATFMLNSGVRDDVACNLRWEWERRVSLGDLEVSVFRVPNDRSKVHKKSKRAYDYIVCNSAAQAVVDSMRGLHKEFVFVWRRERTSKHNLKRHRVEPPMSWRQVQTMNNTAWQRARTEAGLDGLHVHDLRHTVGTRLRAVRVSEETRALILWHGKESMTTHYSAPMVREVRNALELITRPSEIDDQTLESLERGDAEGLESLHSPFDGQRKEKRVSPLRS